MSSQQNEQILNDIQSLQQLEQQLFNNLESNAGSLTQEEQQQILEKMNQLSTMRINLYQTLSGVNNYYENALNSSVGTLKEQLAAIQIVEAELNKSKKRLELLEEEKNNKIRLVEINNYFGEKYAEHSKLMKIVICMLIPIIILTLIFKKGLLPNPIYYGLIGVISLIGAYFFWKTFASIIRRDNMNYDEYNWFFDPNSAPVSSTTTTTDPWASTSSSTSGTCVGDACCASGLTYDYSLNQCIVATTTTATNDTTTTTATTSATTTATESFVNHVLTKTQPNKYKNDYDMKQPRAYK